jgi:phosphate acetyltransferase
MNNIRENILNRALQKKAKLILPEIEDIRIQEASIELKQLGIEVLNISEFKDSTNECIQFINEMKFTRNWSHEMMAEFINNPLQFCSVLLAMGKVDGMVAGAINSSADVLRTAIRVIGVLPKSKWVSSIFLMVHPDGEFAYTFTDCAVIPEPTSDQLVSIAKNASEFHLLLTEEIPKIAFLSFSTKGSSEHYRVKKVKDATIQFTKNHRDIIHEGEIQFDAAINLQVANRKIPHSLLKGNANTFVFPNLDAGNISYKITERLAGYSALGPLLQGLKKPIHDLSRGCSVQDIIDVSCITALQKDMNYANI